MQKKCDSILPDLLLFLLCMLLLSLSLTILSQRAAPLSFPAESAQTPTTPKPIFVIDPGHGGEDAGAIAENGALEKDLNLQTAFVLCDILRACGCEVVLTREHDVLLYDPASDHVGHKKEQDLATRLHIAQQTPNAIFVSIHMNAYPQTQYSGLQVWYSPNDPDSALYAESVQSNIQRLLQPENERRIKKAGSNIYLLDRLECPAILIECGFLSNQAEATALCDPDYRQRMALLIALSLLHAEENRAEN